MLAHTNTTRNVSVRACARVRACVTERWRERERRALTLKIVPSSSFFFCTSHREREHFFLLWFPLQCQKTQQKVLFFFAFFCLFSVLPFLFFDLPYKKNHHSRRRKDLFSSSSFFFCVCFFLSLTTATQEGDRKISLRKSEKGHPFFPWIRTKSTKKKRFKKKRVKRHVFFSLVFLRISLNRRRRRRYKKLHTHLIGCVRRLLKTRDRT